MVLPFSSSWQIRLCSFGVSSDRRPNLRGLRAPLRLSASFIR